MANLPDGKTDPCEIVYCTLDGPGEKYEIKIDEVLAHSEWRPNFSIAEKYHTDSLKVFLAGDAAHRIPPHGGYGMNSGAIDAIDLGWRLAAITKGYGNTLLLRAYNLERRPMMIRALERSLRHLVEHIKLAEMYAGHASFLEADTPAGEEVRLQIRQIIDISGPDTTDYGIELDLRYDRSPVIYQDGSPEHEWDVKRYIPSTRPGCRAPHVFLKDGVTSIYDLFGPEWTLVHFIGGNDGNDGSSSSSSASEIFLTVAESINFPLTRILLHNEDHVHRIWENRDMVLVRPDTHVVWRAAYPQQQALNRTNVKEILRVVAGYIAFPGFVPLTEFDADIKFRNLVAGFTDMYENSNSANATTILGEDL